jgi:hypothetical protein
VSPVRREMNLQNALLVVGENQRDDTSGGESDVGAAGRRIGRCRVLRGLASDNAAQ